ncbi:hypothetical protein VK792_15945 [Mesobacterium sp. TK19101]|uniref:Uncharacterized protein n=1 Tax=Mesobacterium hydrothermale TaxID=3111907 RepID=A0ABU6HK09_9RHOB|nr:hypothetical protein [Mesobacterium sp. TK19101]MEC3862785.1 hypothetical protein [Mesobacterium sp. TK19101]
MDTTPEDRAAALVQRIEAATGAEADRLRAEATAQAATQIAAAHERARQCVRDKIASLRRQQAELLRFEAARLDTARRHLKQHGAGAIVAAGLPALEQALASLWNSEEGRRAWAGHLVETAVARLFPGDWTVQHPAGLAEAERRDIAQTIEVRTGFAPAFAVDPALSAGLQIRRGGVCLDASIPALIGQPQDAGAALLAELARGPEDNT